jgi:hypothetical protein
MNIQADHLSATFAARVGPAQLSILVRLARGGRLITVQTTFPSVDERNGVMALGAAELGQKA